MISFASDYIGGAHPEILKKLVETNAENLTGYGTDIYSDRAIQKIREACGTPDAQIQLLVGGTQTNQIVISSLLQPYDGVIAAKTGHISLHEAGAIEYTGHKVIELDCGNDGKLTAESVKAYLTEFYADATYEHMVIPGMVYITFPTELGTLYSKAEMQAIHNVCQEYKIPLYVDGARLGYGLASKTNDITLKDMAQLCDVFYIGGTKVGALCGEAVVFHNPAYTPKHMLTQKKQRGGLLAKGRLLGVQFDALFTDNLYGRIGDYAIEMGEKLKAILLEKGCQLFVDTPTNQKFVILENKKMEELSKEVEFLYWGKYDDTHSVIRLVVSWSTTEQDLETFKSLL